MYLPIVVKLVIDAVKAEKERPKKETDKSDG